MSFFRFISPFIQTTLCDIAQELCELQQSGTVPHSKLLWWWSRGIGSAAHPVCFPGLNRKLVTVEVLQIKTSAAKVNRIYPKLKKKRIHSTGFLLLLQPSNQATVLLWNAAVCILTRRLDVFMSRDGRCGEVQGCCRFLCRSAPSDTGPGKTRGSLRRFGCSKVTTWQSSGVDLRRV